MDGLSERDEVILNHTYTHPITRMMYRKVDDAFYFKSCWQNKLAGGWVRSGMKRGFVLSKKHNSC